jgi:hypothetical protein
MARPSFPLLLSFFSIAALAACTNQGQTSSTGTSPPDDELLAPPAQGQGFQLKMTTTIPAGVEAEHCQLLRAPEGEDLWVQRDEVRFTQGSHHVLVYETPYDTLPTQKEDGTPIDPNAVFDCTDGATKGFQITKLVGGSQNGEGDSLLSFPEGVAMRVRAGAVLLLNAHYVNASDKDLTPEVRVNIYTIPKEEVKTQGDLLFLYNPLIKAPASASSSARMRCPVHTDITIANVQSHMHRRGVGYAASVEGQDPFYTNTSWANVPVKRFEPGLVVKAGSVLDYHCDYTNPEAHDVYQGPRSTDEMCMLIGSYYPADPATSACRSADGKSMAGEWVGQGKATCAETLGCVQKAFSQKEALHGVTDCMIAADPAVSKESSAAVDCIFSNKDPVTACKTEIDACLAK